MLIVRVFGLYDGGVKKVFLVVRIFRVCVIDYYGIEVGVVIVGVILVFYKEVYVLDMLLSLDLGINMGWVVCIKIGVIFSGIVFFKLSCFDGGGMCYL